MGMTAFGKLTQGAFTFIPREAILLQFDLGDGSFLLQVTVSPDLALDWLTSRNITNRRIKDGAVARYAHDMNSEHWRDRLVNPIHFAIDGALLNGQHRLRAIVESGATVAVWVQVGCQREWLVGLDCGMSRTQADVEKLTYNRDRTHGFVAIARSMRIGFTNNKAGTYTPSEMHEFMERHERAIQFVLDLFPTHIKAVTTAPMMAVVARAYYSQSHERLAAFAKTLTSNEVREPYHSTVVLLRNWMQGRGTGGSQIMSEYYSKTQRALLAFCEGRALGKLYSADTELFPLPGERA